MPTTSVKKKPVSSGPKRTPDKKCLYTRTPDGKDDGIAAKKSSRAAQTARKKKKQQQGGWWPSSWMGKSNGTAAATTVPAAAPSGGGKPTFMLGQNFNTRSRMQAHAPQATPSQNFNTRIGQNTRPQMQAHTPQANNNSQEKKMYYNGHGYQYSDSAFTNPTGYKVNLEDGKLERFYNLPETANITTTARQIEQEMKLLRQLYSTQNKQQNRKPPADCYNRKTMGGCRNNKSCIWRYEGSGSCVDRGTHEGRQALKNLAPNSGPLLTVR